MSYSLFNTLVYVWIGLAIITFFSLFFVSAPYGRFSRKNWGPVIPNWLGWVIMELPSLLTFSYFVITGEGQKNAVIWFIGALWVAHYINRTFIYPFRITSAKKKMPFAVSFMAITFNLGNGFFNGYYLGNYAGGIHDYSFTNIAFLIGLVLFFAGAYINLKSDRILMNLRKNTKNGYMIPYGGFFKYVSSPNYLGELIEWLGFAIMVAGLPAFSFFIWTFANLVPRALDNHKWYKKTFADYPPVRKAIFPYLL
jgi:3-oxo-5-alpha-steroid 4-dehydrogenase 1